jgi:hypothetical protein
MESSIKLDEEQLKKLDNISSRIVKVFESTECNELKSSCLNSIRQCLEYLCLFTCEVYEIKITRASKKGDVVENDNPTLGDMAPLMEKYFKANDILWSKEVAMHIGSIWMVGNLGSHAQKEMLQNDADINHATIENALNSMYIVTDWFYKHYGQTCPIKARHGRIVSEKENEVTKKTNQLYEKLAKLKYKNDGLALQQDTVVNIRPEKFEDIYFEDLIEAIELGKCVLFIGPNLSVNEFGNSLHKEFYKNISQRNIEYNDEDGFFMPKADKQIELKALNYYGTKFHDENTIGNRILKKLAQIPFSLIVSVTPDNTMKRIFDEFNKKHEFIFYNLRSKQQVNEPSVENPVIFNMLGNAAADGKYIFTHKQFFDYVNQKQEVKIPFEIESKIKDVAHYLFIGIDFNKWYNRLLLFALNLYDEAEAYSLDSSTINEIHQDFVNKQFNISFIKENYEEFVDVLVHKCKEKQITRDLVNCFIENTIEDISKLVQKPGNEDVFEKLSIAESKINKIENLN